MGANLIPSEVLALLNVRRMPACLTVAMVAALLGRRPEHITILVESGLLEPLGDPPKNGVKWFAFVDIEEKAKDIVWLGKATRCLTRHWKMKNSNASDRRKASVAGVATPAAFPISTKN